jgi:hypothetical protein
MKIQTTQRKFQWDCTHHMKNFNHEQIDARWYFRLASIEQNIMGCITTFTIGGSIMGVSNKLFLRPIV